MKKIYLLLVLFTCSFYSADLFAVASSSSENGTDPTEVLEKAKSDWNKMTKKEQRLKKKEIRKGLKQAIKDHRSGAADEDTLLLVIITILIPPLGMYLYEDEINNRFWLSLVLTILGYVPGLIYTLVVILGEK